MCNFYTININKKEIKQCILKILIIKKLYTYKPSYAHIYIYNQTSLILTSH